MNNKITFPRLATMIANQSGRSKRFSEDFLREFFSLISKTLEAQESVKIKGLGTFRLTVVEPRRSVDVTTGEPMEISGHTKVVFTPAKELAEAVNAPFEAFSAIEIKDGADIEQLFADDEVASPTFNDLQVTEQDNETDDASEFIQTSPEDNNDSEIVLQPEAIETLSSTEENTEESIERNDVSSAVDAHEANAAPQEMEIPEETEASVEIAATEKNDKDENEDNHDPRTHESVANDSEEPVEFEEDNVRRKNRLRGMMIALGAAVIAVFATLIICYAFGTYDFNRILNIRADKTGSASDTGLAANIKAADSNQPAAEPAIADSISDSLQNVEADEEVPTAPSDIVVYDTIGTTRYLTTMAKSHYGNFNLWPYIYQENQSILGHPDRIRPGTAVVIPKLSKYGVDPTKTEDIEKAKKLGVEIYARYGKKI